MKLTRRGIAIAFAALSLAFASVAFNDSLIEITLFCALVVIAAEAAWVRIAVMNPESKIRLTSDDSGVGSKPVLHPGDESVERVRLVKTIGGKVEFESMVPFLEIDSSTDDGRMEGSTLEFRFKTRYAGEYSGREVGVKVTSPLGLFSSKSSVPFDRTYTVYPVILSVAAAAIRLLGKGELGETTIELPGTGGEFYELRGYQPGDDFRKVNWKATARRGELMLNAHTREVGSSFLLVLDARSPGFRDTDRLASTFLAIANGLASSAVNFGILVHDGRMVTAVSRDRDYRTSLESALRAAVSITKMEILPAPLELAPAATSPRSESSRSGLPEESVLAQIQDLRRAQLRSALKDEDPWVSASRYLRDGSSRSVIYVSGMFDDLAPLIELAWQGRQYRNVDFTVANPCEPWATAGSEDEALRLEARFERLAPSLGSAGISYFRGDPFTLAQRILSG
jgi:uncharacterized protein (DUF58 family)